jgi:hypothetical protein
MQVLCILKKGLTTALSFREGIMTHPNANSQHSTSSNHATNPYYGYGIKKETRTTGTRHPERELVNKVLCF